MFAGKLHAITNPVFESTSEQIMNAFKLANMTSCRSPKQNIKQLSQSIIHFHWHLLVSRCTFHTPFAFPVKWDNQFHTSACFISLIKSWRCQLGAGYLRVQFILLLVYRGWATVESQEGPVGRKVRYQLLWPRQMSARQSDNLWPRSEEKIKRGYMQDL